MLYVGNFSYNDDKDQANNYCLMPCVVEADSADEALEKFASKFASVRAESDLLEGASEIYLDSLVENADAEDDEKLAEVLQESQKKLLEVLIRKALEYTGGNKKRAAELLRMSRKTLYNIMSREKWDV